MTKTCQRCGKAYTRVDGILRLKQDYGFCSMSCMATSKQPCPNCGTKLIRNPTERPYAFAKRLFCSRYCARRYANSLPKSAEARAKMSEAQSHRTPEHLAKIQRSRSSFYASEKGADAIARQVHRFKQWYGEHPEAVSEMVRKQRESRIDRGVYQSNSERMTAFYQTPEGQAQREHYRQLYSGKPRPPRVTEKMKVAVREFWDSPEGMKLREQKSIDLTEDLDHAPNGPGWVQQASRARTRDGHACAICGVTQNGRKKMHVHHIYSRRRYGYVPGQNHNYLWANHLSNLISLCTACHQKVHMRSAAIPETYQLSADMLWQEFMQHYY